MYTYEQIKKYLLPHIVENVICVFKNGSQLFCEYCKDYDYTLITKDEIGQPCFHINDLNIDCFVMSIDTLNQKLKDDQWRYKLSVCLAKIDSSNIIYGELPDLDIDILSREYLLKIMRIEKEFADKTYFNNKGNKKTIVWGLALYYYIINNSFVLSEEQKNKLQKCHDTLIEDSFISTFKTQLEYLLLVN